MRKILALGLAAIALGVPASALDVQLPRPSGELVINLPGNKQDLLSKHKGKVVCLAFIFTTCPHCQAFSQVLSRLKTELGPKGFEPLMVAVNPMAVMLVPDFVRDYHVNFQVGAAESNQALNFMHISPMERWVVPQIAVIDRKGNIRAQTPFNGDEKLQTEANLKGLIESLLKEGSGATASQKGPAKKKAS